MNHWQQLCATGEKEVFAASLLIQHDSWTLLKFMQVKITSAWAGQSNYTLYRTPMNPENLSQSVIVRRQWARGYDHHEVVNRGIERDTPTILIDQALLDETFETLWIAGTQLALPIVNVTQQHGHDGSEFVLEFFSGIGGACSSTLRFWSGGPDEWKPLVAWMHQLLQRFDQAIASVPPQQDTRTDAAYVYGSDWWQTRNQALKRYGNQVNAVSADELATFEAELAAPLPDGYRQIMLQFGADDAGKDGMPRFTLHTLEHMRTLLQNPAFQTIATPQGNVSVLPFASDEQSVLLLELTPSAAVWRATDTPAQRIADSLVRFIVMLQRRWQIAYEI